MKIDIDSLEFLLESSEVMKGSIRARGDCPKCGRKWEHFPKIGYICSTCKTTPSRFLIDDLGSHDGKRIRIYSDKTGQVLDSYQRALTLQLHINYEIDHHVFDATKYVASDIQKFLFENQIAQHLKDKEIEEGRGNLAPSYISVLKNYIHQYFLPYFTGKDVREIDKVEIRKFYQQLPQRSLKTLKNIMDALEHFFRSLYNDELISRVPVFPTITVPEYFAPWVTEEKRTKLVEAMDEIHRPIIQFILFQGVRESEARALKWKDVDLENRQIIIRRTWSRSKLKERTKGKNIKPRWITPLAFEALRSVPRGLPEAFVFTNRLTGKPYSAPRLAVYFRRARQATGVDVSLHIAGRHSIASQAGMAGVEAWVIRDFLGHASTRTTEKYVHLDVVAQKQMVERSAVSELSLEKKARDKG